MALDQPCEGSRNLEFRTLWNAKIPEVRGLVVHVTSYHLSSEERDHLIPDITSWPRESRNITALFKPYSVRGPFNHLVRISESFCVLRQIGM
jgi:hypothetical protein